MQVYGRDRTSKDVRQRWLASGIDMLLGMYGRLQVSRILNWRGSGTETEGSNLDRLCGECGACQGGGLQVEC